MSNEGSGSGGVSGSEEDEEEDDLSTPLPDGASMPLTTYLSMVLDFRCSAEEAIETQLRRVFDAHVQREADGSVSVRALFPNMASFLIN